MHAILVQPPPPFQNPGSAPTHCPRKKPIRLLSMGSKIIGLPYGSL